MVDSSREIEATGMVLIFLGIIGLVTSSTGLPALSAITGIKIEFLILASIGSIPLGIAIFVVGYRSREDN